MPIEPEELRIELAKASAEVAAECAAALAELDLLRPDRSRRVEDAIRRMADLCRRSGGDVSETVFLELADGVAKVRQNRPWKELGLD